MGRGEPALVPEWYRVSNRGVGSSATSSKHQTAAHSDDHGVSLLSARNMLPVGACEQKSPPGSLALTGRTFSSSSRSRSGLTLSTNDSVNRSEDSVYGSFGRNRRREKEKEREKEDYYDLCDKRDGLLLVDNGLLLDISDSLIAHRSEKDSLRRSRSTTLSGHLESMPTRPGIDLNNGVISGATVTTRILEASFERDFPSLGIGSEEKQGLPDTPRALSPDLSTALQSRLTASARIGSDGRSALADKPGIVGINGSMPSTSLPTSPLPPLSMASCVTSGLNMAETLVQTPSPVCTPPLLSADTQRTEELTLRQRKPLIPMTPSLSKSSVLNSSEKLTTKGARGGDFGAPPKVGQQSSHLSSLTLRGPARSDSPRASQTGNFLVLNRDRNGISPTAKDRPTVVNSCRVGNPLITERSAVMSLQKSQANLKLKGENKGTSQPSSRISFGQKRPISQAQDRIDFFNSLRKKSSVNLECVAREPSCGISSSNSEREVGQIMELSPVHVEKDCSSDSDCSACSADTANGDIRERGTCKEQSKRLLRDTRENCSCPDPVLEKEVAFMRSLGWEENGGEEALTAEEIDAFVKEHYEKLSPSLKLQCCPNVRKQCGLE